jgi:hypothetical protein
MKRGNMLRTISRGIIVVVGTLTAGMACFCCKQPACPVPGATQCALGVPASPALPHLFRARSTPPANGHYATAAICTNPHGLSDECEVVDDVQAILGSGFGCENGRDALIGACEGWTLPAPPTLPMASVPGDRPCGDSACKNLALVARDPSGCNVRVTFYDDISCHGAPKDPNCPNTQRACYYRVLRVDHI